MTMGNGVRGGGSGRCARPPLSPAIRSYLSGLRPTSLRGLLARLKGYHQLARGGAHQWSLGGKSEPTYIVGVHLADLGQGGASVFTKLQDQMGVAAALATPRRATTGLWEPYHQPTSQSRWRPCALLYHGPITVSGA